MKVSIIVPSYMRSHLLRWNLWSLSRQVIPHAYEIIILNDGIEDDTTKLCSSYKEKLNIKYFFTGQRNRNGLVWRIPGYAINIGVKQSDGDIIILCCAEMFHMNNSIQLISAIFEQDDSDKIISIPQAKDDNGLFLRHLESDCESVGTLDYVRQPKLDNVRFPFFMAMRRESFIDIGGYDEDFTGTDFDDTDFVRRLVHNGCEYKETNAMVVHLWHPRLPMSAERKPRYDYNQKLYNDRENIIVRNVGREWGIL